MTGLWKTVQNLVTIDWWIILGAGLLLGVLIGLARRRRDKKIKAQQPHTIEVVIIEGGFKVLNEGFERFVVNWPDIQTVTMITTDTGPWLDDLFYHIVYSGGDLTLPSEATGMGEWIGKLTSVPGFDFDAYMQAITSTQNNSFVVVLKPLT